MKKIISLMAAQAFTLGPKEYNRYQERLKRIDLIIEKYSNITNISNSLEFETSSKCLDRRAFGILRYVQVILNKT